MGRRLLLLWTLILAGPAYAGKDLMHPAYKDRPIPQTLYTAYSQLVTAMKAGNSERIKSHCLAHAVTITASPRQPGHEEIGIDINLPYAKSMFSPLIMGSREDPLNCFLIRTGTSYFHFIRVDNAGWKLYRYGDKPIQ